MKTFAKDILVSFLLGVIVPALILGVIVRRAYRAPEQTIPTTTATAIQTDITFRDDIQIPVLLEDGTTKEMNLETYLCGVVLAEMPADFEQEALKAQAVVSRTYALRRLTAGTKHENGAVCTDPACCQGYMTEEQYGNKGGSATDVLKISQAVQATAGEVLVYQGNLIDATYFSCSGGRTEDALAVWGSDVPYLQATDSPGEEMAAYHTDEAVFSPEQVEMALSLDMTGDPDEWFTVLSLTDGGGVAQIDICGQVFSGVEVRKALGLRSAAFTVTADENSVTFYTRGYGHRVGMSQYGADAMALAGNSYNEILTHYYCGTNVAQYQRDD